MWGLGLVTPSRPGPSPRGTRSLSGGLAPGEGLQVRLDAGAVPGRGAVVVGDQAGARGAGEVGVPGPGQVADALRVHPAHQRVDVAVRAVVLAELPGDDRHLGGDRRHLAGPAGLAAAGV